MSKPSVAVLGTGNSGHAFAGDIALKGHTVNLADVPQFSDRLEAIAARGGIEVEGVASVGFAELNKITTDMGEAIDGVDMILIGAPAFAHEPYSRALAPHLQDGQFIVFVSNFAALRFRQWMRELGVTADVTPVETQSLIYATRSPEPGRVEIFGLKSSCSAAALPASRTAAFLELMAPIYPQFEAAQNVLATSINNFNPVVHPPMTLLNAGRIESTGGVGWNLYGDGATESVAAVMEAIDAERMRLGERLGLEMTSLKESFAYMYRHLGLDSESLSDMLRSSPIHANPNLPGTPPTVHTRYVTEDVPFGMAPWSAMGREWGLPTPTVDAMIQLASVIEGKDYRRMIGAEALGIAGLQPKEVRALVD
jgi:opine dehydrogenase